MNEPKFSCEGKPFIHKFLVIIDPKRNQFRLSEFECIAAMSMSCIEEEFLLNIKEALRNQGTSF